MFFFMLWQPWKKSCLNGNVLQSMVQNLGLFKKIIITKNRKTNCLITIISLITTVKKFFQSCMEEANFTCTFDFPLP